MGIRVTCPFRHHLLQIENTDALLSSGEYIYIHLSMKAVAFETSCVCIYSVVRVLLKW